MSKKKIKSKNEMSAIELEFISFNFLDIVLLNFCKLENYFKLVYILAPNIVTTNITINEYVV